MILFKDGDKCRVLTLRDSERLSQCPVAHMAKQNDRVGPNREQVVVGGYTDAGRVGNTRSKCPLRCKHTTTAPSGSHQQQLGWTEISWTSPGPTEAYVQSGDVRYLRKTRKGDIKTQYK